MPRSYLSSLQRFKLPDSSVVEFDAAIKCADDADFVNVHNEHDDDADDNDDDVFVRLSGLMAEHARKQGRTRLAVVALQHLQLARLCSSTIYKYELPARLCLCSRSYDENYL